MATNPQPHTLQAAEPHDEEVLTVTVRLPRRLVRFLDGLARRRFTTRNEVIKALIVKTYHSLTSPQPPSDV